METTGKKRSDYKRLNRGLVLRMIATQQCQTRAALVQSTGLSKMAISNIVSELIGQELVEEVKTIRVDEPGRRSILLQLSERAPKVAGLLIRRTQCSAVLCDLNLNILRRETAPMEDMTEEKLIYLVYQLLDTVLYGRDDVLAIGVASVGPISSRAGKILRPFYFYDIHDVEIVRIVQERYNLPVCFDHDNQCAMLAESLYGNGRGHHDALFVGVSEGLGCGILSNGQMYCNRNGLSPELGHISIDVNGPKCTCGRRGCVEVYLRTPELLRKLQYHTGKFYTYQQFCAIENDEMVDNILMSAVDKLTGAVVSAVNIFNSELVLLGNDSVYWPDRYLAAMEERINQERFVRWDQAVKVKRAYFMQDSALLGAACNAIVPIFNGKMLFDE